MPNQPHPSHSSLPTHSNPSRLARLTEIRGPYYAPVTKTYLDELLSDWGEYVDGVKFARGAFSLMPEERLKALIETAHKHEHGFRLSSGFLSIPTEDWAELIELTAKHGLKPKPEVGIQWGAGGDASVEELENAGTRDPKWLIDRAKTFLEAGAYV